MTSASSPLRGRAIVTYGRSLMSLAAAHSLAARGIEVIGCDDVELTALSFSRHVKKTFLHAPMRENQEGFLNDLEAQVLAHAPDGDTPYVLMPIFRETKLLARHRDRFEPAIKLAAPRVDAIDLLHPKDHLAVNAQLWGLPAPTTLRPASWEELADKAATLRYPLLLKPADGVGGRGIARVDDAEELRAEIARRVQAEESPAMAQQFVDGEDYCVTVLADRGDIKAAAAYRNVLNYPREAGAGALRETVEHAPFMATARALVARTGWSGVAEIDFRWSGAPGAEPYLIEVNPRFWAGLFHSIDSGVDFPWLLYKLVTDGEIGEAPEPDIGRQSKVNLIWLLAAVQDVAASDRHFERAREAWRTAQDHLVDGETLAALKDIGRAASEAMNVTDLVPQVINRMGETKGASSELMGSDDPFAGLGVLFVLGSLLRHGKLPPEIKYEAPKSAAAADGPSPQSSEPPLSPAVRRRRSGRPVIGVTKPEDGDNLAFAAMKLAVRLAGGEAVKITAKAPRDPRSIDGLIFGGGSDVYPDRYGGAVKAGYSYDLARDDLEASWAKAARAHELPVLGVCRGAQMLNVLAGGGLIHDVSALEGGTYPTSFFHRAFYRKPITLDPDSLLADIVGDRQIEVNSIHTQGIGALGRGLREVAQEANGLVQAIEDPTLPFWLGVQFHPEFMLYRGDMRNIFARLVDAARGREAVAAPVDAAAAEAA